MTAAHFFTLCALCVLSGDYELPLRLRRFLAATFGALAFAAWMA